MTAHRGRTDEPPFLQIKFPSLNLPGQCDIKICQVHVVSLEDEVTIVEQVLKSLNTEVDPIALFLSGRPVQLSAREDLAEKSYHSHFAISHHVEVTTDTVVGSVSLENRCSGVLQEVKFLAVRDSLLTKLESGEAFCRPDKLASPLVFPERNHVS